jgi:hypothetical protein
MKMEEVSIVATKRGRGGKWRENARVEWRRGMGYIVGRDSVIGEVSTGKA